MKKLNTIIPLVIYPFDIMFSFGESDKELKRAMRENNFKWKFDCKFVDGTNGYFKKTKQGGLIRLKHMPIDPSGYAMLQHEIFHAVETSLSYFGFTLTDASCEAYAYLIGYLTEKVYEILKVKRH